MIISEIFLGAYNILIFTCILEYETAKLVYWDFETDFSNIFVNIWNYIITRDFGFIVQLSSVFLFTRAVTLLNIFGLPWNLCMLVRLFLKICVFEKCLKGTEKSFLMYYGQREILFGCILFILRYFKKYIYEHLNMINKVKDNHWDTVHDFSRVENN